MRKSSTTAAIVALGVIGLSALTACGGKATPAATVDGKLEKTAIKVGGLPLADYATLYWAKDKGFFDKVGLRVEIVPLQGGPVGVQQVAAGQLDFSFTNTISGSIAQSKGTPITTVVVSSSIVSGEMSVFVNPNSPIKTIDDLGGKSLGTNTTNNIGDVAFKNLASSMGKDIKPKWVEVPYPEMIDGVRSGAIEAGSAPEPFRSAAVAAGLREVVDLTSGPNDQLAAATFVTSENYVKENPDTVAAFVEAMYAANKDLAGKEPELRAWLPKIAGVDQATAKSMVLPSYDPTLDIAKLDIVVKMLQKQGLVPDAFAAEDHTYVPKS